AAHRICKSVGRCAIHDLCGCGPGVLERRAITSWRYFMERENRLTGVLALLTCLTIPVMLCVAALLFFGGGLANLNPFAGRLGADPAATGVLRLVAILDVGNLFCM